MANGTTFHNFAKREAENTVDWAQVSKDINTALSEKAKAIETERATVEKNSREFITTLNDSTQSENQSVKDWALAGANNIQDQALILKNMLRNGKLKKRDYDAQMQALTDGGTQLGQLVKSYNEEWQKKMDRTAIDPNTGLPQAQDAEGWFMEQMEGFSNFKSSGIFVNPLNSKVSIGKRVLSDPSKPFNAQTNPYTADLSNNPNDYATLPALLSRQKVQYNMFDANTAVTNQVKPLGKVVKSVQMDKRETWENALQSDAYKSSEQAWIESTRAGSNILNVSSVLTNSIGQLEIVDANGKKKLVDYGFTQDVNEAKNDPSLILFSQDDTPIPIFDQTGQNGENQIKAYDEFMQTMMRGKLNDIETARKQSRAPTKTETDEANAKKNAKSSIGYMRSLYSGDAGQAQTALSNLSQRIGGKARFQLGKITPDHLEVKFIEYIKDPEKPGTYDVKYSTKKFDRTLSEYQFVRSIASSMSDYGGIDRLITEEKLGTEAGKAKDVGVVKFDAQPEISSQWNNLGKAYKKFQYETTKDMFEDKTNNTTVEQAYDVSQEVFSNLTKKQLQNITLTKSDDGTSLQFTFPTKKDGKLQILGVAFEFTDTDEARADLHDLMQTIYENVQASEEISKKDVERAISRGTNFKTKTAAPPP